VPPTRARGFTLIELLIVVSLLAIIGVLAFPTVSGSMADARLRGALNEVRFFLAEARARAMERNVAVVVKLTVGSPEGGTYTLWESSSRDCSLVDTAVDAPVLGPYDLANGREYRDTGMNEIDMCGAAYAGAVDLCFRPEGGVYERPGLAALAGPLQMLFTRYEDGNAAGVTRILRLDFNGIPRIER